MPKPPPLEYFEVTVKCPKEMLGLLVADFNKHGLSDVSFNLITATASYKRNGQPPGISNRDFLAGWLKDHPTFKALEAARAFEADGRDKKLAYPTLTALVEKGLLQALGEGMYARTDVRAIEGPKRKQRVEKGERKTFDKRGEDVIMTFMRRNHGRANTAKIIEMFLAEGRARNSVYASFDALMKSKMVKRVGDAGSGQYMLLAKAKKVAPKKSKPNGAAPAEVEIPVEA